jgi:hypothetical protein
MSAVVALGIQHVQSERHIACHLRPVWIHKFFCIISQMARFSGEKNYRT